ncbi:MAG: antibiotic ABC transporter [Paracoccus sp. (in: a-proteobacteria)]|uniref:antibiotic ABC transporter n=1 Tax=Paracoccus sp. TaxID=267 RepID=UPI0026DF3B74|nr:antibiotic ABC transporter [Paracoccus sp. (in: a-proteobacteria)]MDO5620178.1 antibiotic ABC transporter [Paracoccus sp. (in: a-proteobacteria)]
MTKQSGYLGQPFADPFGLTNVPVIWAEMARIGLESQMVIGLRVAGMMGFLPHSPAESRRMVREKHDAAGQSLTAVYRAATDGKSVDQIMSAALKPYRRRTRENARRLTQNAIRAH